MIYYRTTAHQTNSHLKTKATQTQRQVTSCKHGHKLPCCSRVWQLSGNIMIKTYGLIIMLSTLAAKPCSVFISRFWVRRRRDHATKKRRHAPRQSSATRAWCLTQMSVGGHDATGARAATWCGSPLPQLLHVCI